MTATFTDLGPDQKVQRNGRGQPLIKPAGGTGKALPYTRVSSLANYLNDQTALSDWKCRMAVLGMHARPDLRDLVPVHAANNRELNRLIETAQEAAGSKVKANIGSALHGFTEHVDKGNLLADIPVAWQPHVAAYQQTMADAGLVVLDMERFVVNDDIKTAGTFDRRVMLPDGRVIIADIKSGSDPAAYPLNTAMQVAIYARSLFYDPDTGTRSPIDRIDTTTGLLIHLSQDEPKCTLHRLDLTEAWDAVFLALDVRAKRSAKLATPWPAA